jgi:hypothetical protein
MSPFEVMYGNKCIVLISWENLIEMIIYGLDLLREMEQEVIRIK